MGSLLSKTVERMLGSLGMTSTMQEAGQGDDVVAVQIPLTVAEMWALVPRHVRDELLDHLDLRQATRLTRVSLSWSEEMKKIVKRSNGIVVLEDWITAKAGEEASEWPQLFTAVPKSVSVSHLILMNNDIVLVCQFKKYIVKDDTETGIFFGVMTFACPYLEVPANSLTNDHSEITNRIWRLLDSQGLLWPYPEQIEWLLRSLSNLEGQMLEAVKFLDNKWLNSKFVCEEPATRAALNKLHVTSKSSCDERRFISFDLAFLGRLLVSLDKEEKIPGQEPPPYAFPDKWSLAVICRPAQD